VTEGDDNVDLSDPFTLPWPPDDGGFFRPHEVDIDLTYVGSSDGLDHADRPLVPASLTDPPQVHAVVVAEHAAPHLTEVLQCLADQSYDRIVVTILNATGDASVETELGHHLGVADWVDMPADVGFAALANWAIDNVDETESPFLLILDDATALAPAAISYLVEEMYRSNAGIVGPKLVDWNDPSKLLAVGFGADRRGRRIDLIEEDEFDQDQYSAVSDVFVIPTGAQLIRSDLFKHLGGFDPVMSGENEDLDLCWRAHAVAARVIVVPQASARIAAPIPSRALDLQQYRERARHRLRTLGVTTSRWSFPRTSITAFASILLVSLGNLLRLRPSYARASLGAIPWNLGRTKGMRSRRRELQAIRQVGDSEIHALQSRIGPSVGSLVEQSLRPTARISAWTRTFRRSLVDERQRVGSTVAAFLGLAILTIVFGTWDLIGDDPVVVGFNPILPEGPALLEQWWSGFRQTGLGVEASSPLSFVAFGLLGLVFAWSPATLHLLLLVGPLVLGALGTFRLVRPLGGPRSAAVATAIAVANPLTAEAFAAARWDTLVLWAFAPFLLISAARLAGLEAWSSTARPLSTRIVRYGVLTAVGAWFAPPAVVVAVLAAFSVTLFGLISGRLFRVGYGAAGAGAAIVVPAIVDLRFARDVVSGDGWKWIVGTASPEESVDGFAELLQFAPGRSDGSWLMWGLIAAASLGLLFGRKGRFEAAVLGWTAATVGFVVAWIAASSYEGLLLPGADVVLTLSAAGLALGVGASVRSVQIDLKRYGYGWRQFATIVGALGGVAVLLLGFGKALDGRHGHPEVGYAEITSLLGSEASESRVLWLGDPRVVVADTSDTADSGVSFAITNGGTTTIQDRFLPAAPEVNGNVGAMIDVAIAGDTVRLGRLLAPFGIDYLVFQPQLAPAPYEGPSFEIDSALARALDDQLDLRRQAGTLNLLVFRNEASSGTVVVVDDSFDESASTVVDLLDIDLSASRSLVPAERSATSLDFDPDPSLSPGDRILIAQPARGWQPTGGAGDATQTVGGLTLLTVNDPTMPFGIAYEPPSSWWGWTLLQAFLILGAILVSSLAREHARPRNSPSTTLDLRSGHQTTRHEETDDIELESVGDAS
jgi:GT2 family glycosyltransferase